MSGILSRELFTQYMKYFNEYAASLGRKYLLTMDCLSSHILKWEAYQEFRKSDEKAIFIDEESFSNIVLCYLPAKSTAFGQPSDMGK